ncbi:MAG TPA: patatin-like phospholipase family protein [Solirubrobacteraceae bacterium]|nr:patatin-like phospholipase family protein [Solirubrobacteraceae bacterium]
MDADADTDPFGSVELLQGLSAPRRQRLIEQANRVRYRAGEWLFREGDSADCAYIVQAGRIEIVSEGTQREVLRTIKRGGIVGELALLRRTARSASARAIRDCELLELSREDFEQMILEDNRFALSLCRLMSAQLAEHRTPATNQAPPRTVAIIALDDDLLVDEAADRLAQALASAGETAILRADGARDLADHAALIDRAEANSRWVILAATGGPADPWTRACLAEADRIVALSRGRPNGQWLEHPTALHGCELLILGRSVPESMLDVILPHAVQTLADESATRRSLALSARRLNGRAVGIVFSGGGARAFAHLGVVEELRAAGVQIDRVAGASMGALVAAVLAREMDDHAIYETFRHNFVEQHPSRDYTLPVFSLIRGRKTLHLLEETFGRTRIEQLPLRFFCVSADLNGRSLVVHRIGLLRDALFASLAIPGVFPPIPTQEGRLLVDGGVLDNLPVETMARDGEGPVIAVDVTGSLAWRPRQTGRPSLWRARARALISGQHGELPSLAETILLTLTVGGRDTVLAARRHADLVLTPAVERSGLLEWGQLPKMREAGRESVRRLLESDPEALKRFL